MPKSEKKKLVHFRCQKIKRYATRDGSRRKLSPKGPPVIGGSGIEQQKREKGNFRTCKKEGKKERDDSGVPFFSFSPGQYLSINVTFSLLRQSLGETLFFFSLSNQRNQFLVVKSH